MTTKSSILTLVLAALALAGLATTAQAAAAAAGAAPRAAPTGLIAFVDNRAVDSGGEIYSVATTGGSSRDLSNSPARDSDPVVSPNGHRIAFFNTGDGRTSLYTIGTDGTDRRRSVVHRDNDALAELVGGAAWSPDGKSIAFHAGDGSTSIVGARGGAPRRLGRGSFPAWSEDGHLIALTLLASHEGQPNHVVVVTTSGRRLWSRPGTDPAWSPDSSRLAFTSSPDRSHPYNRTVVADGQGRRLAVLTGSFLGWSPDGELIAFGRGGPAPKTVYVARWNGREAHTLGQVAPDAFAWSPDSRQIAFFTRLRHRAGVWVAAARGGRPRLIASSSRLGGYAAVDGWARETILLSGNFAENDFAARKLYLVRPDGGGLRLVARAAAGSSFSSAAFADGGRTVVYRSDHTSGNELFTVRPDGTQLRQVTADGRDKQTPAWSPDGTAIAYAASNDVGRCAGCEYGIVVREAATGKTRVVGGKAGWFDDATDPAWAPDGNGIAYGDYLDPTIVVRRLDGSSKVELGNGEAPSWSPDGTLLVFVTYRTAALPDGALAVMNADGSNVRQVLPGQAESPAWSPDGQWIAYVTKAGAIRAVRPDGTDDHLVLAHAAADSPAWSPDGEWIAYTGRDGYVDVVRADGSEQHRVTKGRQPSWRPVSD